MKTLPCYQPEGEPSHRDRFARLLATMPTQGETSAIGEAVKIAACIEWLRTGEGDTVSICCENPEPEKSVEQEQVICSGEWTDWGDLGFYGKTVLQALETAVQAREEKEKL